MLPERTQRPTAGVEHDVREPALEMGLARHAREDLGRRPIAVRPQDDLDRVLHRAVAEGDDDAVGRVEALDPSGSAFEHVELRTTLRREALRDSRPRGARRRRRGPRPRGPLPSCRASSRGRSRRARRPPLRLISGRGWQRPSRRRPTSARSGAAATAGSYTSRGGRRTRPGRPRRPCRPRRATLAATWHLVPPSGSGRSAVGSKACVREE